MNNMEEKDKGSEIVTIRKSKRESLLDYVEPVRMNMPKKKDVARLLDLV